MEAANFIQLYFIVHRGEPTYKSNNLKNILKRQNSQSISRSNPHRNTDKQAFYSTANIL